MPAFYAHERFGKKVWQQTEGDLKESYSESLSAVPDWTSRSGYFFLFIVYIRIIKFQNTEQICMRFRHTHSFYERWKSCAEKGERRKNMHIS